MQFEVIKILLQKLTFKRGFYLEVFFAHVSTFKSTVMLQLGMLKLETKQQEACFLIGTLPSRRINLTENFKFCVHTVLLQRLWQAA